MTKKNKKRKCWSPQKKSPEPIFWHFSYTIPHADWFYSVSNKYDNKHKTNAEHFKYCNFHQCFWSLGIMWPKSRHSPWGTFTVQNKYQSCVQSSICCPDCRAVHTGDHNLNIKRCSKGCSEIVRYRNTWVTRKATVESTLIFWLLKAM